MTDTLDRPRRWLPVAALTALSVAVAPLAGCGRDVDQSTMPAIDESARYPGAPAAPVAPQASEDHSLRNKLVVLGGAAALYYLYKKHQQKATQPGEPQYYLSKNGRVYYRDAQHRVHWVTPPPEGIRVPASEAEQFREFQGYDNRPTGRDLRNLPEAQGDF